MSVLIKNAKIIDAESPLNGEWRDVLVEYDRITEIAPSISTKVETIIEGENLHVSIGWMDVGARVGDPGLEHREDVISLAGAASAGGYTAVATLPNTSPSIDNKSGVNYLKQQANLSAIDIFPIAAVTEGCDSLNLAELYDMRTAGAVAFSDGLNTIQHSGVMMRALLYAKSFDGLVMNHPLDKDLAKGGQINEGVMSTSLGMRGIPHIAEELLAQRDIYLLEYTDSKLHLLNLSSKGSLALAKSAKGKGQTLSVSVPVMNIYFTDKDLADFDTNLKVWPPLRGDVDQAAIIQGIQDGTIDLINSNHQPHDEEGKNLEFAFAEYGAANLETTFSAAWTKLNQSISIEKMVTILADNPRRLLGLERPQIKTDAIANLTIFDPDQSWTFEEKYIRSKSKNNPFVGHQLQGKVIATVHKAQTNIFE